MTKKARNYNRRYPYEYNIFRTIFYMSFLYVVVIPFMKIFYNYTITGRENLPTKAKSGKFIYTANHVSHFDPPMVTMACGRPIAYMAKKELFEESYLQLNHDLKEFSNFELSYNFKIQFAKYLASFLDMLSPIFARSIKHFKSSCSEPIPIMASPHAIMLYVLLGMNRCAMLASCDTIPISPQAIE